MTGDSTSNESGKGSTLVYPGQRLSADGSAQAGHGVRLIDGNLVAMKTGNMVRSGNTVTIEPLSSRYVPRASDLVVGYIEGMTNNIWFVDIGAAFNAILPMSLAPWKVEFGAVRQHLGIGDAILCRVQEVDETHSSVVTMKGMGLRKLKSGFIEEIPPHIIGKVIGKGGGMLQQLKSLGQSRMIIGQNGRIWIDGELSGMSETRKAMDVIRDTAHLPGLNERVAALATE